MIDMSQWEDLVADVVHDLRLDPRNVRLDLPDKVPESDIIQDLFANEKALDLVESIARVGFLTHEVPIVVERSGEFVVVEGNRRVAALKAIQNPHLAPDFQTRISRLAQEFPDRAAICRITVKRAPSQDDADQLVAALHTGNQRRPWSPSRQAAFFQAQLDAGKTPEELIQRYPTVDVRKFITRSDILEIFRSVNYDDPDLGDYTRKRSFPVSVLARLFENGEFLDLVGIQVQRDTGRALLQGSPDTFKRVATKILGDMRKGIINTRILNKVKSKSYQCYLGELRNLVEDDHYGETDAEHDQSNRSDLFYDSKSTESVTVQPGRPSRVVECVEPDSAHSGEAPRCDSKPLRRKSNSLKTDGLSVPEGFPEVVRRILSELSDINIVKFPNATFDLLRSFLEKTIKAYAESIHEDILGANSSKRGHIALSACLEWVEGYYRRIGNKSIVQVVKKIKDGGSGFVESKECLDAINHNHNIGAEPDDVRRSWNAMFPLMKAMLS